ncbi:MAG TPA: DUF4954 family protein, partial [Chitinophagaceae bacterium]|nr:DUF4954 family protein [Chitinophagaceae bacterium]
NLRMPVGLYNSTIISCDIGDNVVIENVNYISHYVVGNEAILVNVNEINSTDHSKFGNGLVKVGESEKVRIWLEVCNENGGRSILPFDGMLAGDAWLWTRFRDNQKLQNKLKQFTDERFDLRRGYYGQIGDRTIIKNTAIIKDVWIGSDAYIKGANKLKNLTINSSPEAKSQIGEGCELVNGIIGHGCRIFYGVKAVRFVLSSNSQLKYGARLINSYLGDNSTISCCEVLNSLIFPSHEQHHNNSFLCAALVMGQSNMAAGATIGSNHNSRSPDGELIAGRGFWPGLCVSLKHNSKFASFAILAKGDYPFELNISIPFSLISNDVTRDELVVMPGYWFLYNMYALARNSWKYVDRDKRTDKTQLLEFAFLAPDTINEIASSLQLFATLAGKAFVQKFKKGNARGDKDYFTLGKKLFEAGDPKLNDLSFQVEGFENGSRPVRIIKMIEAYKVFRDLINYYAVDQLLQFMERKKIKNLAELQKKIPVVKSPAEWSNVGGQLIMTSSIKKLVNEITRSKIKGWDEIHAFYHSEGKRYEDEKLAHALAVYQQVFGGGGKAKEENLRTMFLQAMTTRQWMNEGIRQSREKDYENPFRQMVYESDEEMNKVVGSLDENTFIIQENEKFLQYKKRMNGLLKKIPSKSL